MAESLVIDDFIDDDIEPVVALWTRCGLIRAWNDPSADIAFVRRQSNAAILVAHLKGRVIGSVMVGHDGHRGWLYYLAVDPAVRGQGYGRSLTQAAEQWLVARGIVKVMLMVREDNHAVHDFYRALGYFDQPRTVFAKWLDDREPTP